MIVLENVTKAYGLQTALDGLTLTFREGAVTGLLGPNGAGKTTLVSILVGILPKDRGRVVVGGHNLDGGLHEIRRISCLVPQNLAFYPSLTARENLSFFGAVQGLSGDDLRARLEAAAAAASLESFLDKRAETFSGGMKRRLNLAIGLLGRPRVLYLDEPTVGVDAQSRTWILETIRRINREEGTTVVYASHYMDEVEQVADDIVILDEGKIVLAGGRDELLGEAGTAAGAEGRRTLEELFLRLTTRALRDE
jgi:ABC-2 type transport system ATP-binding protein